jgi:hypothetical protein
MITRTATLTLLMAVGFGCDGGTTPPAAGDAGTDAGTDTDGDAGDYDCAALPPGPFELVPTVGIASKDVAFDAEGNLVGSDYTKIYKTSPDGETDAIETGIASCTGIRYLPNGKLIYAEELSGRLVLLDEDGEHEILSTLHSPRGLAVDLEGLVYVTDPPMNRVKRVAPYTFEEELVVEELYQPSVLAFDVDYDRLFIATGGETDDAIYYVEIGEDGTPGEIETFATGVGQGWHTGMAVDACGYVYVVEHQCDGVLGRSCVHRISPEGLVEEAPIAEMEDEEAYLLAGIEWGSDIGGWDGRSLYLGEANQDSVYRMDVGVPSKPKVFP